mmetsp:Transcript_713/g.1875  ORF Transcript_713/g.1875 Transcript_713/m.1875 type:complete len:231 (+) Transcript_713:29-721(+)
MAPPTTMAMRVLPVLALLPGALGFAAASCGGSTRAVVTVGGSTRVTMAYVPDGLTPEQYKKIKDKEAANSKNLGSTGTNRFQSRSMYAFQKALESGTAAHLFPVDPNKVKSGEIKAADVPYMQRKNGKWDQSDVKGAAKNKWNRFDIAYENSGKDQDSSVSIFGGDKLPWNNNMFKKTTSFGPDKELIKQWKAMGIKVDQDGNPITASSTKNNKAAPAAEAPKKKLFGFF